VANPWAADRTNGVGRPKGVSREDMQRTNLSGILKLNSVFETTISCHNKSGFNLKIPDTAKEIISEKPNVNVRELEMPTKFIS
jgi:hypothetical protein